MNSLPTPESSGYQIELDLNPPFQQLEWNTLEKFIDWQRDRPQFSPPDSLISDFYTTFKPCDYPYLEPNEHFKHSYNFKNRAAWAAQATTGTMPPMPCLSPPHSMHEDSTLYSEEFEDQLRSDPTSIPSCSGPQLPKIGRPRSIPTSDFEEGGQPPTQAKRRSQNREAQRAFRTRQRQYIDQLASENRELIAKNQELEARCEMLTRAYEKVLSANPELGELGKWQQNQGLNVLEV